ncbi:hypothetical protein OE88DRAFT_1731644 [Heliocybe sulcata]|uniref:Uncharacterized protein n=1 Tax=Heliocybe sulcata TaxID=5364 RepID=A0A5C3NDP3_9AGAM|nr:hypothetical protein OE88DRAFT_1731644 [Heliocybe sulcata]
MSRFTSTPFHKPSPFDVPRAVHPLSPPDTDSDFMGPAQQSTVSMTLGGDNESATIPIAAPAETPASRFRKISTLAYLNSGLSGSRGAEPRERVQPRTKWLVVVVPPNTFPQEPGHLGHTLSSGPSNRLSSGLLMPLFPTMYGQLSAIAKEFNFPSTTGLCLYLHVTESGFTFTPRISDESWQLLWGHLFEARSPVTSSPQLPISGRIEFDIDLRKARWYDGWVANSTREAFELSVPASRAPSMSHWRADSRTTFAGEEQGLEDQVETESITQRTRTLRHVPRKLSLLDRFDTVSVRSASRAPSHAEISPKQEIPDRRAALSPIVQEDEPKSGKKDLESRVRSWRASSSVAPTPMAVTGQLSLDPVNMPNTVSLDSPVVEQGEGEYELNLDDFTWSISSAGPEEYYYELDMDGEEGESWRAPSVHMDRRVEGSVCLTPSVATSMGPEDYDLLYSPVSNVSRLPSPDLGLRVLESVPPTPSTATSWGPSDRSLLYSPMSNVSRLPSPDVGRRMLSSVPPTPSTATSWGPASYYSNSNPSSPAYAQSVDLGQRNLASRPNTPSTATSWGPGWASYPPSPASPYYVRTPDLGQRRAVEGEGEESERRFGWPYYDAFRGQPWKGVWPYTDERRERESEIEITVVDVDVEVGPAPRGKVKGSRSDVSGSVSRMGFPYYKAQPGEPWTGVWPYQQETAQPWSQVWPYRAQGEEEKGVEVRLKAKYPAFSLYPATYPYMEIYPPVVEGRADEKLAVSYPRFSLYPAVYPAFEIYPGHVCGVVAAEDSKTIIVTLTPSYPTVEVYPAVYPHLEVYPVCVRLTRASPVKVTAASGTGRSVPAISAGRYPHLVIYPAVRQRKQQAEIQRSITILLESSYPALSIYRAAYPHMEIYPGHVHKADIERAIVVALRPSYPALDIYPAVYPWSLVSIYPTGACHTSPRGRKSIPGQYPDFDLYPAKHYPCRDEEYYKARTVQLKAAYPALDLYPALYPYFTIYPAASGIVGAVPLSRPSGKAASVDSPRQLSVTIYPCLLIYPAVYPCFDIYPASTPAMKADVEPIHLTARYPILSLYTATYPFFEIYPGVVCNGALKAHISVRLDAQYPAIRTYESVYPYLDVYPAASCSSVSSVTAVRRRRTHAELHDIVLKSETRSMVVQRQPPRKTHFQLHKETLAPHLRVETVDQRRRTRKTHIQLRDEVFAALAQGGRSSPSSESPSREGNSSPEGNTRRRVSFAADTVIEAPPRVSRSRSGTVSRNAIPPVPPIPPQFATRPPASAMRRMPKAGDPSSNPAQITRPMSTVIDSNVNRMRGSSVSPVTESPTPRASVMTARVERAKSMILPGILPENPVSDLDRSNSLNGTVRRPGRTRESLVSERMKAFNTSPATSPSERSDSDAPPMKITLNALSQFPMPPAPKLPPLPNGRPVSKLDRSKYPFA